MSFLNSGEPGFYNAPISKAIITLTVTVNLIGGLVGSRRGGSKILGYGPSSNELLLFKNWWRFITGPLVFTSIGELFFGIICLYIFRLFERQWGSQKYAMFVLLSVVASFLIQLAAVVLLGSFRNVWSGPYAIIFACLTQYIFDVPSTLKYKIFGLNITEKHVVYLLCIQLLMANLPNSLIAGASGLIAGFFYRSQPLHLKTLFFPESAVLFCVKYINPLIASSSPPERVNNNSNNLRARLPRGNFNRAQEQQMLPDQDQLFQHMQNQLAPVQHQQYEEQQVHVDEENVQILVSMGFTPEDARRALVAANNDVNNATELLLSEEF
ncbi:hypothetical protein AKO1_007647 [Acrasis kona]|uniref:UBA domain-containing protein n=1 Tax=Acrasis kona TaxID=1008807 RepID=A0AAW2YRQ5_9EUKA